MSTPGFASPVADASHTLPVKNGYGRGVVEQALVGMNGWTIFLTLMLVLVAYDQGQAHAWLFLLDVAGL